MVDLSVIIVNWNSVGMTRQCLESLKEHTAVIDYEVFVTDNGTTKDDGPTALTIELPCVRFTFNDTNFATAGRAVEPYTVVRRRSATS